MARKKCDRDAEVRRRARERVGPAPPASVIPLKTKRKKPKHKKPPGEEDQWNAE
ncbi:MAG: hypothetical protein RMK57_13520 [Bryobacterales bacterium]|nr:hypothetical protein [Bryobacteraceae bacterium]MDW8355538.1 hypothetical protein [Bryobacterales bacterium]